jgi:hypothetical protein
MLSKALFSKLSRPYSLFKPSTFRQVSLLINDQGLTEEQKMIQDMAYSFTNEKILPNASKWEEEKYLPVKEY